MYAQKEMPKENKSRATANSVAQKKSNVKQGFEFVDNRAESVVQKKLQEMTFNNIPLLQKHGIEPENTAIVQRVILNIDGYEGPPLDTDQEDMPAIKSYLERLINEHNEGGVITLFDQISLHAHDRLPAIQAHREAYLAPLTAPKDQFDDAHRMATVLKSPVGQGNGPAIPQSIHRFWSGGPLSKSAMGNLRDAAAKTEGTPWIHTLWYSSAFEKGIRKPEPAVWKLLGDERDDYKQDQYRIREREAQRHELIERHGYRVRAIEELVESGVSTSGVTTKELEDASRMAVASAGSGNYDDLKYFSDIARLMYLHAEGGHHMDVDIGLGDMDMRQQYSHNDTAGEVPLMGTLARDMTQGGGGPVVVPHLERTAVYRRNPYASGMTEEEYDWHVRALAERARDGAGMYNAMIATQAGTANVRAATNRIMASMRPARGRSPGLVSGMGANAELLGGDRGVEGFEARQNAGFAYSVPPYLLRLEHLTDESES